MSEHNFSLLFQQAAGDPVYYKGEHIFLADKLPAAFDEHFRVTIESTNSRYIQGVGISSNVEVFGDILKKAEVFEHLSLPTEDRKEQRSQLPWSFEVVCKNTYNILYIYNIALVAGNPEWWTNGCAMKKEQIENGWRYFCNDVQYDDDFDDIVFRIEKIY